MRKLIDALPFEAYTKEAGWRSLGNWPALWVTSPDFRKRPQFCAFRLKFSEAKKRTLRLHVSADERYELFLDGVLQGRGPERGEPNTWFFETYDLALEPGEHTLVARVFALGDAAPAAQMSVEFSFLCAAEGADFERFSTGQAAWEVKELGGISAKWGYPEALFAGTTFHLVAAGIDWGFERGLGEGWVPVVKRHHAAVTHGPDLLAGRFIAAAMLPGMVDRLLLAKEKGCVRHVSKPASMLTPEIPVLEKDNLSGEVAAWNAWWRESKDVTIAPKERRRVILDLEEYYCAYTSLVGSGGSGAKVRLAWAEALYMEQPKHTMPKGNRNEIEGKFFTGVFDDYLFDGGAKRSLTPLWWRAGRYLELVIETADEPLTLHALDVRETRYPLEQDATFSFSDKRLEEAVPVMRRALQMCAHETYMDCPYYEQLMYEGDTRIEALATYVMSHDSRLPRKAVKLFARSLLADGFTQARFPCKIRQVIAPFSLWWIGMVHDYASWRGDHAFIAERMPAVRAVLDAFLRYITTLDTPRGARLLKGTPGWNFADWTGWHMGIPPEGNSGVSAIFNGQLVYALQQAAELEEWAGDTNVAKRWSLQAKTLSTAFRAAFWDKKRELFADDLEHKHFTQHTQCLAIIAGIAQGGSRKLAAQALLNDKTLTPTTIYFSHYLFEAFAEMGWGGSIIDGLSLWFEHNAMGLKTTLEKPEPSRSDCHAWGAHPMFHYAASIVGIRPAEFGFKSVRIVPSMGTLEHAQAKIPHPDGGFIDADLKQKDGVISGRVTLPKGINGTIKVRGKIIKLKAGGNKV